MYESSQLKRTILSLSTSLVPAKEIRIRGFHQNAKLGRLSAPIPSTVERTIVYILRLCWVDVSIPQCLRMRGTRLLRLSIFAEVVEVGIVRRTGSRRRFPQWARAPIPVRKSRSSPRHLCELNQPPNFDRGVIRHFRNLS